MTSYFKFLEWWLFVDSDFIAPFHIPLSQATVDMANALGKIAMQKCVANLKYPQLPLNTRWLQVSCI